MEIVQVSQTIQSTQKAQYRFLMAAIFWLRSTRRYHMLRVRNEIIRAIRQYL
jgi:aspartyl/asparaginyl-tRNA synthetase